MIKIIALSLVLLALLLVSADAFVVTGNFSVDVNPDGTYQLAVKYPSGIYYRIGSGNDLNVATLNNSLATSAKGTKSFLVLNLIKFEAEKDIPGVQWGTHSTTNVQVANTYNTEKTVYVNGRSLTIPPDSKNQITIDLDWSYSLVILSTDPNGFDILDSYPVPRVYAINGGTYGRWPEITGNWKASELNLP